MNQPVQKNTLYVGLAERALSSLLGRARRLLDETPHRGTAGGHGRTSYFPGRGLAEEVDEKILHAAFVPFGEVKDVKTPLDQSTQKHRSFGFVTFLEREDAAAAMDNMDGAELFGRVLTVNYAFPERIKGGEQGWAAQPIWADADTWFERQQQEEEMQRLQAEQRAAMQVAEKLHREKLAAEREGEKEEEADPMAAAEAQALKQSS
ncbi:peptidyl-prolyl cis-trans isomerase E [Panicum miliaceum]|uniref:Peptidyl-prolyl cis-trans isomerase E n=1 Tax=Panicum miliaceum TaxID=4540 RepID=A0A3L6S4B6_PANMI|nr:peptidyl-prolyl cis-trans isomerase E [Panicum miliaceum]